MSMNQEKQSLSQLIDLYGRSCRSEAHSSKETSQRYLDKIIESLYTSEKNLAFNLKVCSENTVPVGTCKQSVIHSKGVAINVLFYDTAIKSTNPLIYVHSVYVSLSFNEVKDFSLKTHMVDEFLSLIIEVLRGDVVGVKVTHGDSYGFFTDTIEMLDRALWPNSKFVRKV